MRARCLAMTLVLVPLGIMSVAAQATGIREVSASDRSVIQLHTKIRYTTMVILPDDEENRYWTPRCHRHWRMQSPVRRVCWSVMFCRIGTYISPPWLALPDKGSGGRRRGRRARGASSPLWMPAEVCSVVSWTRAATDRRLARNSWSHCMLVRAPGSVRSSVGRRVVPPEEPGIVPQLGRERPPTWPPRLVPGPLRGVAHVPAAWLRFEMDWARDRRRHIAPRFRPECAALRRANSSESEIGRAHV